MGFERYKKRRGNYDYPMVSINKHGQIYLNRFVQDEYKKGHERAAVYFNLEEGQIGIQFEAKPSPDNFRIWKGKIMAPSFFKHYNIRFHKTVQFEVRWNERELMLIIPLGGGYDNA